MCICIKLLVVYYNFVNYTTGRLSLDNVHCSNLSLIFVVHGPTALICALKLVSCGAEDKVNGWYSFVCNAGHAILIHWPDLYWKFKGLGNVTHVTPTI